MTTDPTPRKVEIAQSALDNMTNEIWALRRKVGQLEQEREPGAVTLDNLIDKISTERDQLQAALAAANATIAERDDQLSRIADTTQGLLPVMNQVDAVTMDASSSIRKLFIQARLVIGLVEAIARGE